MANNHDANLKNASKKSTQPPSTAGDNRLHHQQLNSVRRRLDFGSTDNEDDKVGLFLPPNVVENDRQRAIEKWNFDFENEVPLEGDWVWQRVPVAHPETAQDVVSASMTEKQVMNRSV